MKVEAWLLQEHLLGARERLKAAAHEVAEKLSSAFEAIPAVAHLFRELTGIEEAMEKALAAAEHGSRETVDVGPAIQALHQLREILRGIRDTTLQDVWNIGLMDGREEEGSLLRQATGEIEAVEKMITECRHVAADLSSLLGSLSEMVPGWSNSNPGTAVAADSEDTPAQEQEQQGVHSASAPLSYEQVAERVIGILSEESGLPRENISLATEFATVEQASPGIFDIVLDAIETAFDITVYGDDLADEFIKSGYVSDVVNVVVNKLRDRV